MHLHRVQRALAEHSTRKLIEFVQSHVHDGRTDKIEQSILATLIAKKSMKRSDLCDRVKSSARVTYGEVGACLQRLESAGAPTRAIPSLSDCEVIRKRSALRVMPSAAAALPIP